MKLLNKANLPITVGVTVVVGVLGLAVAPAAFAAPASTSAPSASPTAPECVTFDQMIAAQYEIMQRPGETFGVLNAQGGFAESSSTPGPEFIKGVNKMIADYEAEKAEKIAKGASCIGHIQ